MIDSEKLFELGNLEGADLAGIEVYFTNLPEDQYAEKRLRSRRYSCYRLTDGALQKLSKKEFMQSKDINKFVGDVERSYEQIEDGLAAHPGFVSMFSEFARMTGLSASSIIEAHQIRWHAKRFVKIPAPEGIHRDGFDFIAIFMVDTFNLDGGDVMIYKSLDEAPVFRKKLENGEFVVLNDKALYHYAAPLIPRPNDEDGHWDLVVLTANNAA